MKYSNHFKNIQTHPILEEQAVQARAAEQQSHTERTHVHTSGSPHPTTRLGLPTAPAQSTEGAQSGR